VLTGKPIDWEIEQFAAMDWQKYCPPSPIPNSGRKFPITQSDLLDHFRTPGLLSSV
jgi:hypothetical protein